MSSLKRSLAPAHPGPDLQVQAVTGFAEQQADLTAEALRATGVFSSTPPRFPGAFLLELGAVLQLGVWESQGIRDFLEVDLPTFREARRSLGARALKGPAEFEGPDAAPLSRQVLSVWIAHFAWEGRDLLKADVVLRDADEDLLADALAEFLWEYRHELSNMFCEGT